MTDKEQKIKAVYNGIYTINTTICPTVYDVMEAQNKIRKLLNDLYEAGRVEGVLSTIKSGDTD